MSSTGEGKRRRLLLKRDSLFGSVSSKADDQPEEATSAVRADKKRVKRVVRAKTPAAQLPEPAVDPGFACLECGSLVPPSTDRCPKCSMLYVKDFGEGDLTKLESADGGLGTDSSEVISKGQVPCVHFDLESGTISYVESDDRTPEIEVECTGCGTLVGFDAGKRPICGTEIEAKDVGLVSLISGAEFAGDGLGDIGCPLCGEKGSLVDGKCPSCGEIVCEDNPKDPSGNVEPVVRNENVVFLHLDVESGEVNYLQRLSRKLGFEQLTVKLNGIGNRGFDREPDMNSVSRT